LGAKGGEVEGEGAAHVETKHISYPFKAKCGPFPQKKKGKMPLGQEGSGLKGNGAARGERVGAENSTKKKGGRAPQKIFGL